MMLPQPDSLAVLASDWYWEQDAELRYTRMVLPHDVPRRIGEDHVLGKLRWELPQARALNTTWARHQQVLRERRPFRDLQYVVASLHDGRPRYMSCSGEPVFDSTGAFRGYRGTSRDITAEWEERLRLERTENLLKMATRLARFGGWAVDVPRMTTHWSEEVCAIHEVPPGFCPTPDEGIAFYAPEHRDTIREAFSRCVAEGAPFELELQIVTATGKRVWVRVAGEAQRDDAGCIVRVQGAFQDISASKALADDRQRMADHLRATLDSLAEGFFVMDRDWRLTYVNPEAAKVAGKLPDALIGQRLWDLFPGGEDTRFGQEYRRAMQENVPVEVIDLFLPLGMWARARAWPTGEGLAVSFVDITAQKAAEAQLVRLNHELEERVRRRTAQLEATRRELEIFSYAIAHDVRAPLASIDGFRQALEEFDGPVLSARGRHFLSRIREATERMDEMTEGILQLARISREPSALVEVNLSALAEDVWRTVAAQDPDREVRASIEPGLCVTGNRAQLVLVLQNLLGNAWKFTARTAQPRVEMGLASRDGNEQVFYVRDNGAGFDGAHATKLFRPFHRMHGTDDFPGTGLGLAMVRKVVQLHGGRVWAEAAPGAGATFFFTLPPCG
jgi:PAS domain S-box-containing protein